MNLNDICTALKANVDALTKGDRDLKVASEVNNGLGKIIRAQTAAVAYAAVHSNNALAKKVPFFEQSIENPLLIPTGEPS